MSSNLIKIQHVAPQKLFWRRHDIYSLQINK
jgi:hypothetical protein